MAKANLQNTLFRKKSIERISSPEQLNEYLRVSTPSVWLVLAAVIVLLVGVCVWGVTGHLETTVSAVALAENDVVEAYIPESVADDIRPGQTVRVESAEGTVAWIAEMPVQVDDSFDPYVCYAGGLKAGDWVYVAALEMNCEPGIHEVTIVLDSVSPMSFLLN